MGHGPFALIIPLHTNAKGEKVFRYSALHGGSVCAGRVRAHNTSYDLGLVWIYHNLGACRRPPSSWTSNREFSEHFGTTIRAWNTPQNHSSRKQNHAYVHARKQCRTIPPILSCNIIFHLVLYHLISPRLGLIVAGTTTNTARRPKRFYCCVNTSTTGGDMNDCGDYFFIGKNNIIV